MKSKKVKTNVLPAEKFCGLEEKFSNQDNFFFYFFINFSNAQICYTLENQKITFKRVKKNDKNAKNI